MTVPVALVINGTPEIIGLLSQAAISAQLLIAECTRVDAPTIAAEMRPLIMVLPQQLYEQDSPGYDALARDVRAALMVLPEEGVSATAVLPLLHQKMAEAESLRPSWPG